MNVNGATRANDNVGQNTAAWTEPKASLLPNHHWNEVVKCADKDILSSETNVDTRVNGMD